MVNFKDVARAVLKLVKNLIEKEKAEKVVHELIILSEFLNTKY